MTTSLQISFEKKDLLLSEDHSNSASHTVESMCAVVPPPVLWRVNTLNLFTGCLAASTCILQLITHTNMYITAHCLWQFYINILWPF